MIRQLIAFQGRQDAERYAYAKAQQHRCERELQSGGEEIGKVIGHGALVADALPQVTVEKVVHVPQVLLVQGQIQPICMADVLQCLLAGLLAGHHRSGIPGNGMGEQKNAQRDPEQDGDGRQNAFPYEGPQRHVQLSERGASFAVLRNRMPRRAADPPSCSFRTDSAAGGSFRPIPYTWPQNYIWIRAWD